MNADPLVNTTLVRRYRILERIGSGGMGIVYRALDRLRQEEVALKRVFFAAPQLDLTPKIGSDPAGSLAREFQILASLRHPHIISVLDYGFDPEGMPYLTMDLLPEAIDIVQAGREQDRERQVRLLTQMLLALTYLHRRGILHRDLKPSNVLVAQDQTVKLLDFGLAQRGQERDSLTGTLAYMAPEVLQGARGSSASDLFSVGVIAYEVFAGEHPFPAQSPSLLIQQIVHEPLNTAPLAHLPEGLRQVIQRLLAKQPQERYSSAMQSLRAFYAALDRPLPPEPTPYREEILDTPAFAGRGDVLRRFQQSVQNLERGGGTYLVSGVSGAGKSRLLNELRIYAAARGIPVLYGRGDEARAVSNAIWRDVLPSLVLEVPLKDAEAGVLKPLIPNLELLLERPIPDLPALDFRSERERLSRTILALFQRLTHPLLLFMDDLQWVQSEVLLPLQQLHKAAPDLPLLIVGAYRSDESPYLYGKFPQAEQIELQPLEQGEIEQVVRAMLGKRRDIATIAEFLATHTGGNALFLVEVLRIMAEDAGGIERIQTAQMPVELASMGVVRVLKQRLRHVRLDDQPMLRLAALLGQEIDFDLLGVVDDEMDTEDWLLRAADAVILTVQDGVWRFSHDKVREALLYGLDDDYLRKLHERAAEALEALHGDNPAYAETIAAHWHQAGRMDREIQYLPEVLKVLYARGAFDEVEQRTRPALEYTRGSSHVKSIQAARLYVLLGDARSAQGRYEEAQHDYEQTLQLAETAALEPEMRAFALGGLGVVRSSQGDFDAAAAYMDQALAILREVGNSSQYAYLLNNRAIIAGKTGDLDTAQRLLEERLAICEELHDWFGQATGLTNLGNIPTMRNDIRTGQKYYLRALRIAEEHGFQNVISITQINLGTIAGVLGQYVEAEKRLRRGYEIGQKIGDLNRQVAASYFLGVISLLQQRHDEARAYFQTDYAMATEAGMKYQMLQIAGVAVHSSLALGLPDEARRYLEDALQLALEMGQPPMYPPALYGAIAYAMYCEAYELAAEWTAYCLAQMPSSELRQRHLALHVQPQIQAIIGEEAYRAAQLRSKYLQLPELIQQLQAQFVPQA